MQEPILTTDHPRAQCVDLRQTFAGRFKFAWDEAYYAERPEFRRVEAAWLTTIPCKFGKIFPWGDRLLAAYCPGTIKRCELERLPCVEIVQGGTPAPEVVVTFDVADFDTVAAVMQPRRRRHLSPEQRLALRPYQFRPKSRVVSVRPGTQEPRPPLQAG